jgi:serine/threonine-protein kinase Chk2
VHTNLTHNFSQRKFFISENQIQRYRSKAAFLQIVSGIKYLHYEKIAHGDLKPENILLCSEDEFRPIVKITDMGLSKLVGFDTVCKTFCGTPMYFAPEVLLSRINCSYDLW